MLVINDTDISDSQDYRVLAEELKRQFFGLKRGTTKNLYRRRLESKDGILDLMGGIDDEDKIGVVKQYFYGDKIDFLVSLFSTKNSEILAVFPGRKLTRIRTAAATALATDILSSKEARILGCIGAGYQASEQVVAISQIRQIDKVIITDLQPKNVISLRETIENRLGIEAVVAGSVNESFREADIILTATNSSSPVITDEYIGDRCYVNSIGSYTPKMREVDESFICNSKIVAVDSLEETANSAGEIIGALNSGCIGRDEINELAGLATGNIKERSRATRETTYFKSIGVGTEDLAVAKYFYSLFS